MGRKGVSNWAEDREKGWSSKGRHSDEEGWGLAMEQIMMVALLALIDITMKHIEIHGSRFLDVSKLAAEPRYNLETMLTLLST
uniref:Uncharacterized protein n=1 Tax=Oryza punctata TaxID=4537 RepID=A0A0E0KA83_ORYPU